MIDVLYGLELNIPGGICFAQNLCHVPLFLNSETVVCHGGLMPLEFALCLKSKFAAIK